MYAITSILELYSNVAVNWQVAFPKLYVISVHSTVLKIPGVLTFHFSVLESLGKHVFLLSCPGKVLETCGEQ